MIILKKAIEGYNNLLKTATESMKFGVNNINYHKVKHITPKKVHTGGAQHLESLDGPTHAVTHDSPDVQPAVTTAKHDLEELPGMGESDNPSNAGIVLALTAVGGYMASKYIYPML